MTNRPILILFLLLSILSARAQVDSLIALSRDLPESEEKSLLYREMARQLSAAYPDSAMEYARRGYHMALKVQSDTAIYQNLNALGVAHDFKNQIDSSLHYYNKGIEFASKKSDDEPKYNFIFAKGAAHYYQGNLAEAIQFYDEALQFWERIGDLDKQSKALNNIGIVYRLRQDYDKAIDIYQRAITIKSQIADTLGLANSYTNLGRAWYYVDRLDSSLFNYRKALELYQYLGRTYDVATVEAHIAINLLDDAKFDEAEMHLHKALPELEKRFTIDLLSAYLSLSIIERKKGNPAEALKLIEPYYEVFTEYDRINSRMSIEEVLYACYRDLGNFEKAFYHQNEYMQLYKESADESRQRLAEEMQARFETREKENTIRLQELEIAKSDREKQSLFFGVAFALLAVVAMIVFAVSKIRSNRKLSAEKAKTEVLLRDRETLLREIHHRVKNNLQVVSSLLSIQGREITDDKAQQAVNESRNRVHSMALIHQFLYGEQNVSSIDMPQYVEQLSRKLFSTYSVDHDQVQLHVEVDPILLDVDTAIPVGLIINELITNALKYAFPNDREGNLWVILKENNEVLTLQVRDDGVGAKDPVPKSTSFGMKLLNAFKQKLEAEFEITNNQGMQIDYHIRKYKTA